MNVVNSPWVWVVMSLVAGGLAPFVTPFNRVQEKRRTESRRQLAAMNEVQRQQLKRNEEAFSALSDTDRQKMRDFHRQMEQDRTDNHGKGVEAMNDYLAWVQSIPPYARRNLEFAEPTGRLGLIKKYLDEQRNEADHRLIGQDSLLRRDRPQIPKLSKDDLEFVMKAIEDDAQSLLTTSETEKIEKLAGIERWMKLLEFVTPRPNGVVHVGDIANRSLLAHKNPEVVQAYKTFRESPFPVLRPGQRNLNPNFPATAVLTTNLAREIERADQERKIVTDNSLLTNFLEMSEDEKNSYLEYSAADFKDRLRQHVLIDKTTDSQRQILMKLVPDSLRRRIGQRPPK